MTHPGQLLKQESLYAGKEMGQNFLACPATARMIVDRACISEDTRVLEIGPGLGALTIPIAAKTRHVIAVEKDRRLVPLLQKELENREIDWVKIVNQDFMKTDIRSLAKDNKLVVMGNLPYNISSQILFQLVRERAYIEKAFLMFQKELADRILALPGKKAYSRLSAIARYAADISFVANIGPAAFFPKPVVDSTVLVFDFIAPADVSRNTETLLFTVIKAAFSKRRKSLKNSLVGMDLGLDKPAVARALARADIVPERRAETLNVAEFLSLTRAVETLLPEKS
ncbi:MAG: 16S rRNA (adenine(1518)-N(6)/adenine(1519)-N(6))-dimethyltransferase RsmA [Desulfotignum sp.]|nr:16S rRNA (adenine(1518)-N(6)/adenine(1519)-N(6))-dimethyltransferase RsmA [Desulfotignum sp.]MCF8124883.1 16S rRNA (adenine(1518)-N(6)/adenine(1519)-N(6))-dimethyltransferase RsmA [Desulfotignum sp.]